MSIHASTLLMALLLAVSALPAAGAVNVCVGSGEACVSADVRPTGGTQGDTFVVEARVTQALGVGPGEAGVATTCGVFFGTTSAAEAGVGCLGWLQTVFVKEGPFGVPCVGNRNPFLSGGSEYNCVTVYDDGTCSGIDYYWSDRDTHAKMLIVCETAEPTVWCASTSATNLYPCGGILIREGACPNGEPGRTLLLVHPNGQTSLACVG